MREPIIIICMYRWNSMENHSYILGAYANLAVAHTAALKEVKNRVGKYGYAIYKILANNHVELVETNCDDYVQPYMPFIKIALKRFLYDLKKRLIRFLKLTI